MNERGQVAGYAIAFMLALVAIILGLAFAFPVNQVTNDARTAMNCSTTTDDFITAPCITSDMSQGWFIFSLLAIAGTIIGARIIFSQQ